MLLTYRFVLWAVLVLAPSVTLAQQPRCALIDIDQSALGGLLEAELLALPNTQWVERTEIQKLLNEQRLQSIVGAQSGNDRRSIGGVLKADVLVLLRTIEEDQKKYAEIVIAETNQGIRLVRQKMLLGKDPANDAEVLVKLASDGIAKSQGAIPHIFAVPPFVSDDLTYEYDYLRSTYAKLLERTLLDLPGVVVVELDEAKAITNEYNLAADGANVERKLPTYVLGEYRNEGRGDDRRVRLSLKAQQGAKVVHDKNETIEPEAVSGVLLKYAQELASSQGIQTASIDPQQEVKLLNERANLFMRLANWDEAQALVEASLLLEPDQPEMHSQAVTIVENRLKEFPFQSVEHIENSARLKYHALQHIQVLVNHSHYSLAARHMRVFDKSSINELRVFVQPDSVAQRLVQNSHAYQDLRTTIAMQLVHGLAEAKAWSPSSELLHMIVRDWKPQDRYAEIKNILLKYQQLASDENFARIYILAREQPKRIRSLEGRAFLQELIDSPEALPHVRQAAESLRKEIQPEPPVAVVNRSNADASVNDNLTFRRIEFDGLKTIYGCESLGGDWDLVSADNAYYLYSQASGLRKIADRPRNAGGRFHYDGKFVWASVLNDEGGLELAVFEPQTGKRHDFSQADGLPLLSPKEVPDASAETFGIVVAPVSIGRAIVVGYVGRTWFADVTFSADGDHQVKIFHEAKETLPQERNSVEADNLNIRFGPHEMLPMVRKENGKVVERGFFLTRFSMSQVLSSHPLLINPDDLTIRVLDPSWSEFSGGWVIDGELYRERMIARRNKGQGLYRRGLGDEQKTLVLSEYEEGNFCYDEGTKILHLAGREWRQADLSTGQLTSLGPVPWEYRNRWSFSDPGPPTRTEDGTYSLSRLNYTRNYGLIAMCSPKTRGKRLCLQVLFDGSGQSFKEVAGIQEVNEKRPDAQDEFRPLPITGREKLGGPGERIADVAYSPDGKYVVTVAEQSNRSVRVWQAESGAIIASLLDDPKGMNSVAFSPAGKYFATGGNDGRVILWDARSLRPLQQWTDLKGVVTDLVFSNDATRLAATNKDAAACVWELESGKKAFDFLGCSSSRGFGKLAFTPDDEMLLAIQAQASVQAYDAKQGTDLGMMETFEWVAGFLPDGSLLGVGKEIDNDLVRRQPDGTTQVVWPRFSGGPIAISKNGRFLATFYPSAVADENRDLFFDRLEIWDTSAKKLVYAEEGLRDPRLAFSPDGTKLIVRDPKGVAKQIELVAVAKGKKQNGEMPAAGAGELLTPMRTWTDKSGQFHIDAALVKWDAKSAVLRTSEGNQLTIPLSVLSEADLRFLKELAQRN
ncbi:hypothetical protein C5Y96_25560 [Blastopirellula marina]|uniref:SLA1 homology domain-containing protein n=1 Tax=Blastopirellula marina TaxID=124 RepID=A0A2S8F026_9BACT|nr:MULTISPECIES: SHD1 domain-containing protein [Pirellulaceae]PQO25274.1 hypothetical protein C5Y96_25560 [Blastopirellula marina]RCS41707.1 hypothetical protein DTL36_25610 [Bremerella cremea]